MPKLTRIIKNIGQLFWPFLEGEVKPDTTIYTCEKRMLQEIENIQDVPLLNQFASMAEKLYLEEKERLQTVEGKGATFLGTSGFAATLLIWLAQIVVDKSFFKNDCWFSIMILTLYIATQVYFLRTIYLSARCLSRRGYRAIDRRIVLPDSGINQSQYLKRLAVMYVANYSHNRRVTNEKTDLVALAQENFMRAVICIGVIGIFFIAQKAFAQLV
ncbi:hypothetical protein [Desulfoscipio geothermicus]|uniref:Uncharacterized protein n=1 Tax=Desulfoscipio geothermicus DSM 3669 TaxID=1121426 RepID=A0A1I6E9H6_9FIRM|nr:hypothetical protein [Desulfoscipio geothermicus]SFR14211.1 hypothetical protein SAMN05660706_13030 [Desulfoscipio geothermicus DSM 3669]